MNRVAGLRMSLLVSLGLAGWACGGTTNEGGPAGGESGSGGTQAGAGRGGTTTEGGTGGVGIPGCTSPQLDPESGLVSCAEGYEHRPQAVSCSVSGGAPAVPEGGADNGGASAAPVQLPRADGTTACADSADCRQFELGFCGARTGVQPRACESGCMEDADCGPGSICICTGPSDHGGECHRSDCTTDADCGPGSRCASTSQVCLSDAFFCQTVRDECATSEDCGGGAICEFEPLNQARVCYRGACGRPFLVEQSARVAPVVAGGAWHASMLLAPRVDHLTPTERLALAEHWTRMGQMEHASIAAVARFSLQLLALGAPPELVEACTRALGDETAHTRLCFALASAYAGQLVGPGTLDISHSLEQGLLPDIVDLVLIEGCFGETSAALQALEAADSARDSVITAAYAQIARDEERHAALAFQFVRWALAEDPISVRPRIEAALREPGLGDASTRAVAVPCLEALLAA